MKLIYSVPCRLASLTILGLLIVYSSQTYWYYILDNVLSTLILFIIPLGWERFMNTSPLIHFPEMALLALFIIKGIGYACFLFDALMTGIMEHKNTLISLLPLNPLTVIFILILGPILLILISLGFCAIFWIIQHYFQNGILHQFFKYLCCCDLWSALKAKLRPNPPEDFYEPIPEPLVRIQIEPRINNEYLCQIIFRLVVFRPRLNEILENFIYVQHCNLPNELIYIILDYNYRGMSLQHSWEWNSVS